MGGCVRIKLRWRCDNEESFITDDAIYQIQDWTELPKLIAEIEIHHTFIGLERLADESYGG
jgi:hypothetical protein